MINFKLKKLHDQDKDNGETKFTSLFRSAAHPVQCFNPNVTTSADSAETACKAPTIKS